MSDDINNTSKNRLNDYCIKKGIKLIEFNKEIFKEVLTKENCKAIGICEKNLAKAVTLNIGVNVNE